MTLPRDSEHLLIRLANQIGVDWDQFRSLVRAWLLMDLRNQQFGHVTYSKPRDLVTPLFWVSGQNLCISMFLSGILFARVDAFFFTLCTLAASLLIMATSIIVEFNEVVLDPDDLNIVGHLPVPIRTYSLGRIANLGAYILLFYSSTCCVPSIVGTGLRETAWWYLPSYLALGLVANLFVAGLVIWILASFAGGPNQGLQEILAWTQAALIGVTFYGAQAVLRDKKDRLEMLAYRLPDWVEYLPFAWTARAIISPTSAVGLGVWCGLLAGTITVWSLVVGVLSRNYPRMQPGQSPWQRQRSNPLPGPGELADALVRIASRPGEERVGYWFGLTMLRRDHNLRMRSFPALAMVAALVGVGLFLGELGNPLELRGRAALVSLAAIYLFTFPVAVIVHNFQFSKDHASAWVFQSAPLYEPWRFANGIRKVICQHLLYPGVILLLMVFAWVWGNLIDAALHALVALLVVEATSVVAIAFALRRFPLSAPLGRGETMGPIAPFLAALGSASLFLAGLHYWVVSSRLLLAGYLIVLVAGTAGLRRWLRGRRLF